MKKGLALMVGISLVCITTLMGCGAKKEETSKAAIEKSKTMQTVKEKSDYLIAQAKAFYNAKDFQGAVDIAQHVLRTVDKDSQQAKDLLEKAKNDLTEQLKKSLENAKKSLGM